MMTRSSKTHLPARGFTLVEVLAAILLIAIVLPAVMKGISTATAIAGTVRHRSEATSLAQSKLNELLVTGDWQSDSSGGFDDFPDYRWSSSVTSWTGDEENTGLELVQVTVSWDARNTTQSITLSTLMPSSTNAE